MFKGLKSKLEDEAKRIQATVSQYSENIAQQVRSGTSENGSDISSYTRHFFPRNSSNSGEDYAKNRKSSLLSTTDTIPLPTDTIISLDDDDQNLSTNQLINFQEYDKSDFFLNEIISNQHPQRFRKLSNASLESNESAFVFPQSSNTSALRLDTISLDIESNDGSVADSISFENVEKEQLSLIFNKLKGRSTNYKQKYHEVIKAYQEVVRENEKYRTVLATTQDKALQRISKLKYEKSELLERLKNVNENKLSDNLEEKTELKIQKLQDLLEKCKDRITTYKSQLAVLNEENTLLKNQLAGSEQDELSVEKVTAEWKGRVDRLDEEWQKRIALCEEKATISIATSKAEMHVALQQKDQEIEDWISKYHLLEKKETGGKVLLEEKLNELKKVIETLENEKADMVEKLSKAKQESVKLVKEDEEKKREKLNIKHNEKLTIELMKKDDEWRKKMKELEEQMQLAIEESDMQKIAALASQDKKFTEFNELIEHFKTENIRLQNELEKTLLLLNGETERTALLLDAHNDFELKLKTKELNFNELSKKIEEKDKEIDMLNKKIFQTKNVEKDSATEAFKLQKSCQNNTGDVLLLENNIQSDNGKAEKKFNSANEENIILKLEADELKAENLALMDQLSLLKQQNEEYLKRCSKLEEQYNLINVLLTQSKVTVNTMTDTLNEIVVEKNTVNEQENLPYLEQNEKLDALYRENAVSKEIVNKNTNSLEITQKEKEDLATLLSNQLSESKETISNLKLQLENVSNTNKKLTEENEELLNSKSSIQNQYDSLKTNFNKLHKEKNLLFDEKEHLKKANEESNNYKNSVSQKFLESEKEVLNLKTSIEELHTKNINNEEEKLKLQIKYCESKETYESVLRDLNDNKQECEKLKQALDKISAEKDLFFEEKVKLKEIYELTLQKSNAKDNEIAKLIKQTDEQNLEFDVLRNKLENEIVALKLEQSINKSNDSVNQIKNLSQENNVLIKRQEELELLYDSTTKRLNESESNLEDLRKRLQEISTQKNRLIDQKESELVKLKCDFEQSSNDNLALKKRFELANQQNKQLAKRHGELEAICEQKNFSNHRLASEKERIESLTIKNTELSKRCEELEHLCELAKPTETEYLRNVLYRYMIERETLGKEIITLARVIGTVVRFTKEQLNFVINKEEMRFNQSWYGGTSVNNI